MKSATPPRTSILCIAILLASALPLAAQAYPSFSLGQSLRSAAEPAAGFRLYAPQTDESARLVDERGVNVHMWPSPFRPGLAVYLLRDGSLLRSIRTAGGPTIGGVGGGVQIMDLDGNVIWDFRYDQGGVRSHHDLEPLPNGNILMIAWEDLTVADAMAAGRDPALIAGGVFRPDHVIEVRPTGPTTGAIVWEWHLIDHVIQDRDPTLGNFGDVAAHPELIDVNYPPEPDEADDWNHLNAVEYDPVYDRIILSTRHQDEIWVIDHGTTTAEAAGHTGGRSGRGGDILYRWGNPAAYRAGTAADQQLFEQHAPTLISDGHPSFGGNLLVFNNNHPGGTAVWELDLPLNDAGSFGPPPGAAYGPAGPVWSYTNPALTAAFASNAERLPNGNTLICSTPQGILGEVTREGGVAFVHRAGARMFHAHHVEHSLWTDQLTVSASRGGTIELDLIAGSAHAGETYLVVGSASGTTPGTAVEGVPLPLNPDAYTAFTISAANSQILQGTLGVLQAAGRANAVLNIPAGAPPGVVGTTLHHAFFTISREGGPRLVTHASNAMPLVFVP